MENNLTVWNEIDLVLQIQWCYLIIICLGFLGNSLSIYIFFCKKVCYSSSSIYLGTLAISDNIFLITFFVHWLKKMEVIHLLQWRLYFVLLFMFSKFLSAWVVVIFTIERYVVIKWPLLRRSWCTVTRAKILVTVLTLMITLHMLTLILTYKINTDISFIFTTLIGYGMPQIFMIIFNILIVLNICKQADVQRTMTNVATIESNTANEMNVSRNETLETKITKRILIISCTFILLNLPMNIMGLFLFFNEDNPPVGNGFYLAAEIGKILYVANFGINFFLYCVSGQNFRKALIRIFWKRENTGRNQIVM